MSNVIDNETGQPLADGKVSHIVDWCGRKIGLVRRASSTALDWLRHENFLFFFVSQIGLVEKEWLDTLSTINSEEVTYTDYVESGNALAKDLKAKGCQFIIALTHMRTPNDLRLAENATDIDLILGGHDHVYEKKKVNSHMQILFFCSLILEVELQKFDFPSWQKLLSCNGQTNFKIALFSLQQLATSPA